MTIFTVFTPWFGRFSWVMTKNVLYCIILCFYLVYTVVLVWFWCTYFIIFIDMWQKVRKMTFSWYFHTFLGHFWAFLNPWAQIFWKYGWTTFTRPGVNFINNLSKISGVPMPHTAKNVQPQDFKRKNLSFAQSHFRPSGNDPWRSPIDPIWASKLTLEWQ